MQPQVGVLPVSLGGGDYLKIFMSLTAFLTFVNGCSTVIYVFKPPGLTRSKGSLGEMGETKESSSSFFLNKHLEN